MVVFAAAYMEMAGECQRLQIIIAPCLGWVRVSLPCSAAPLQALLEAASNPTPMHCPPALH